MATTKFHSNVGEIVPWQAQYTFPSQATKSTKQTVKLVPKNGSTFNSANKRIRFEFPSDGYLNWKNTVLKFDLSTSAADNRTNLKFVEYVNSETIYLPSNSQIVINISGQNQDTVDGDLSKITAGWVLRFKSGQMFEIRDIDLTSGAGSNGIEQRTYDFGDGNVQVAMRKYTVKPIFNRGSIPKYDLTGDGLLTSICYAIPLVRHPQNGGHGLIKRLRVLYGGMVLEDIQEYSTLAKIMYDTTVTTDYMSGVGQLLEGSYQPRLTQRHENGNFQEEYTVIKDPLGLGEGQSFIKRQIVLHCLSGLLDSAKLFPLKWMAAQFAIEIELTTDADYYVCSPYLPYTPSYTVDNCQMIAELHDFDSSFDYAFMTGLKSTGVPIKFSSWHWHSHPLQSLTQAQIHERARSIKAAFSVIRETQADKGVESNLFYHNLNAKYTAGDILQSISPCYVSEFQYRVGGRYHPAQPVDCENGASEAYLELAKTINNLGDFQFSPNITPENWSFHYNESGTDATKFIMAMEFENKDVFPDTISGINGEEQSDINLTVKTSGTLDSSLAKNKQLWTFINYDALLVIRDGNIVELVM